MSGFVMSDYLTCWWCGESPLAVHEVVSMESVNPIAIVQWCSPADHEHALTPPTPEQMEQAGHDALMRIMA